MSDGGKSDSANLQEIFARDCVVALMDPVYPVYADSNVHGRAHGRGRRQRTLRGHRVPAVHRGQRLPAGAARPARRSDLSLLSEQPTGAVITRAALARWVEYARAEDAVILYDAAYEAYIARSRGAPLDLRDRGRARGGDRVPELLEERRASRACAWPTRSCPRRCRARRRRRAAGPQRAVAPPHREKSNGPPYIIQKAGGRRLHARGTEAGARR